MRAAVIVVVIAVVAIVVMPAGVTGCITAVPGQR
jgi:hypothetical protein